MTTKKIYSPWIKGNGGECPVSPDTLVKMRDGVYADWLKEEKQ